MTPEKQVQEGIGSKFTTKQKAIAGGVVVVVLILIWQIIGIFGGGSSSKSVPTLSAAPQAKSPAQMASASPTAQMGNAGPNMPGNTPAMMQQPQQVQAPLPVKTVIPVDQSTFSQQQDQQQMYVSTLNQLQLLKVQRDIDETKQGIAAARLATATAEKNISDLLTKPIPAPIPQVPVSDYANKLGGNIPPPNLQQVPQGPEYVVISVSMRLGRWAAVLGYQGKLLNVSTGDVLPADGSQVMSIGRYGVTLKRNGNRRRISIVNAI